MHRRRSLCLIALLTTFSLAATARAAEPTPFAEAFRQATSTAWQNPVLPVDQDPRPRTDYAAAMAEQDFAVLNPEYFPGWVVSTRRPELTLFHRLPQVWRVGGPTRLAMSAGGQVKVFAAGQPVPADAVAAMDKAWILVWFAGARNWDKFDMPVLVVLQHRPTAIVLEDDLRLAFASEAGTTVVMNLYGFYKPPQDNPASRQFADAEGPTTAGPFGMQFGPAAPTNIRPYEWAETLPAGVVERCDYFASLARAVPVDLSDVFQVDLSTDTLRIRYGATYLQTQDDWNTPARKLAPISPAFLLAAQHGLPITFSGEVFDPAYPTTQGPWGGIEGVDGYEADLHLLQYLSETYVLELNEGSEDPLVQWAVQRARDTGRWPLEGGPFGPQGGAYPERDTKRQNFCWGVITSDRAKMLGMHFVADEQLEQAQRNVRPLFTHSYFTAEGFQTQQAGDDTFFYRHDAGIGGDIWGDGGKLVMDQFVAAWMYAYHGRDYGWLPEKAELMEMAASMLPQMAWSRAGRPNIAELGDEAPPALGYARLQYAARDQQRFAWGAYMAMMELVQLHLKCGPMGRYARQFQPWYSMVPMDDTENATDCAGGSHGWTIGGPGHEPIAPAMQGGVDVAPYERFGSAQWVTRWRGFHDFDVNRFMREQCTDGVGGLRFEVDTWLQRDFAGIGPGASYPTQQNNFLNPAFVLTLALEALGEPLETVRARMNGWEMTPKHLEEATWNWEPAPWIYWALAPGRRFERILSQEALPWTPGLRSRYVSQNNDLVFAGAFGRVDEVADLPYLPFPHVGWWTQPARPKGSFWGLGFITPDTRHKPAAVETDGPLAMIRFADEPVDPDPLEVPLEGRDWKFSLDPEAMGLERGWHQPQFDDSGWANIEVPGAWELQGYSKDDGEQPRGRIPSVLQINSPPNYGYAYDGGAWYRIRAQVPAEFAGKPVFFHAGVIDDFDAVYVNGVMIGKTDTTNSTSWWSDTRMYEVPADVLKPGQENVIAVLVGDNNHLGGILAGPVRLLAKLPTAAGE